LEVSQLGYWYPDMYLSDQRSRKEALSFTKSIPVPLLECAEKKTLLCLL
jgi:hypothetical protein